VTDPQPVLDGEGGIRLRPWTSADAFVLAIEIQDSEIVRWLDIELPYTEADADAFVAKARVHWSERKAAHFVVERDDGFAGYIAALGIEGALTAVEIVYWIAAAHRRRGVASAALTALVAWLRASGADTIELGMTDGNAASAAVAEGSGFVLREVVPDGARLDGESADERVYELPISR
jgi:RimJ/RimL family protein N-acetyltransferase